MRNRLRGLATLLQCMLLAACASTALPSPTPRDFTAVLEALALRGATIQQAVSGDAGCAGGPLHGNAVRLQLTLERDDTDYEIYLFRWRRAAGYEAAATPFEECLAEYAAQSVAVNVEAVELAPWRAFGPAWSDQLRDTLEASLRAAGATDWPTATPPS